MNKLYVFGIGGTGVRVIKSLTFLLAAGVKLRNEFEIVPIIVDPHIENENLKETNNLLKFYEKIRNTIGQDQDFFSTKIRTLKSLSENGTIPDTYYFKLGGSQHQKFKDFLQFDALSTANKALVKALFSDEHLNTIMDIGFVGNPNMGSVVLNMFRESQEFKSFANSFSEGDRVFIVSSIFGGTGAAGFPIVLKNIRRADDSLDLANKDLLKNAPIGGLCVQPYFNVDADSDSSIQKADWMIKTKSAFDYYKKAVTNTDSQSINAMYYLADTAQGKSYKNDPGGDGQKNPAHIVEMIGALSIIDYANMPDGELQTVAGKPTESFAKEFGVLNDKEKLSFTDFGEATKKQISKPLTKLFFVLKYLKENIKKSKDQAFMKNEPSLSDSFFIDSFYATWLTRFIDEFDKWLNEMEENDRGFKPFNISAALPESVNDFTAEKGLFKKKLNYVLFNDYLNEAEKAENKKYSDSPAIKLLDLLSKASNKSIENYFKSLN